jgi:hypothetical protein
MPMTPDNGGKQTIPRWTNRIDGPPTSLQPGEFAVSVRSRRIFVGTEGAPIVLTEAVLAPADVDALYLPAAMPNFLDLYNQAKL